MTDPESQEKDSLSREERNEDSSKAMLRLQKDEDSALSEIIDHWRRPVISFLYRIVGNYEDAADLAQEVFVRIYRNRYRYRPSGSFSSFIFTIASNLAKNHLRWRSRHPEADLMAESAQTKLDSSISGSRPSAHLEQAERGAAVQNAVAGLPEKLRIPLVLFHFQELSHSEIGGILNCSLKTVETRIYRARKTLKKSLSGMALE